MLKKTGITVFCLLAASLAHAQDSDHQIPEDQLEQRGQQLHDDMDEAYKRSADQAAGEVSRAIYSAIPTGTSFMDAEAILSKAGASINYDCTQGVCATVNLDGGWISKTEAVIVLYPDSSSAQHARVGKISTVIEHNSLLKRGDKGDKDASPGKDVQEDKGLLSNHE